ncbi:hypothetical protein BCR44DRAFT_41917 [Catenaria anguillulae PL171]|uniref:Uncharacterized protein n=1 Tax=Catenaria anguillulae PL171 TaxID=765915 RepID=A0A1Y2HQA8_9FUNG|nr:hypothetical protein BCR44DRAFT_41917 [Catenaria anguillulae PL171]
MSASSTLSSTTLTARHDLPTVRIRLERPDLEDRPAILKLRDSVFGHDDQLSAASNSPKPQSINTVGTYEAATAADKHALFLLAELIPHGHPPSPPTSDQPAELIAIASITPPNSPRLALEYYTSLAHLAKVTNFPQLTDRTLVTEGDNLVVRPDLRTQFKSLGFLLLFLATFVGQARGAKYIVALNNAKSIKFSSAMGAIRTGVTVDYGGEQYQLIVQDLELVRKRVKHEGMLGMLLRQGGREYCVELDEQVAEVVKDMLTDENEETKERKDKWVKSSM